MKTEYINPNLSVFSTYEELNSYDEINSWHNERRYKFDNFFSDKIRAFIIGEPGCGKSEILRQIKNKATKSTLILLSELEKTVASEIGSEFLNDPEYIICLDALDEVQESKFNKVISEILNLKVKCSLLVTCRTHHLQKTLIRYPDFNNFKFIRIEPLNEWQIDKFLKSNLEGKRSSNIIEFIQSKANSNVGKSILSTPRYLKAIADHLEKNENTEADLKNLNRIDIFEIAIYSKLKDKNELNENTLIKRVLEKLALIMEIYQCNRITKEELITFLDDTDSNINLIFLSTISIDVFIERVLKETSSIIEFDNTEFQEYLAAKELLRLGKRNQILYDLMFDSTFNRIYKNWFDVLKYVIELEPKQFIPLIDFLNISPNNIIEEDFLRLVNLIDETRLSEDERKKIFEVIVSYFLRVPIYMQYYNAQRIADFYSTEVYNLFFKVRLKEDSPIQLTNQIIIVEALIEANHLKAKERLFWLKELKNLAASDRNTEVQRCALHALGKCEDLEVLKSLNSIIVSKGNKKTIGYYITACAKVNANDPFSISLFKSALTLEIHDVVNCIEDVDSKDGVSNILDTLCEPNALEKFISIDDYYGEYTQLFQNIDLIWTEEKNIEIKLLEIFKVILKEPYKYIYGRRNQKFIEHLFDLLCQHKVDFVLDFLDIVEDKYNIHEFSDLISKYVTAQNSGAVIAKLRSFQWGASLLNQIFLGNVIKENIEIEEIIKITKPILNDLYKNQAEYSEKSTKC